MAKRSSSYSKLLIVTFIWLIACNRSVAAFEFELSSFALYEQGQENVTIDGVSTKYGLGVVGGSVESKLGDVFGIRTRIGYGFHPSANLSLTVQGKSISVTGPVEGIYLEGSMNYKFWNNGDYSIWSELAYISRNVDAPELVGMAGSKPVTGTAVNDFNTLDLALTSQFPIGGLAFLKITGGVSQWNLKTTAVAVYSQAVGVLSLNGTTIPCPCTVTYPKKMDTTSVDPIVSLSIVSRNPRHNFNLEFYNRSLKSKAGTQISGVEFEYKFEF